MKKHKSYLTLFAAVSIFFGLGVSNAFSSTYYVDFASGNDSNAGTSTAAPWVHCPGDPNAAGKAATTTLLAGDEVFFKGGVQYNGQVNVNWSGTSGNTITYDGNSAGNWGTGKAIIDAQVTRSYCFYFGSARNYITINNFELRNGLNSPGLIYASNASSYIEVENCIIHSAGNVGPSSPTGTCIYTSGTYWKIHDNLLYDGYKIAIDLQNGASYNQVYNNEIHDKFNWGIIISSYSGSTIKTDNTIHDNYFHDIYYYDGLGPHVDWIFFMLNDAGQINNTTIYNNIFTNSKTFTDYGGTAMIFIDNEGGSSGSGTINNTHVYNNVFNNPHEYYAIWMQIKSLGGNTSNTYFYNNSFYVPSSRTTGMFVADTNSSSSKISGVTVMNNIWGESGGTVGNLFGNYSNISIDYNNYNTSSSTVFKTGPGGGAEGGSGIISYSMSGWKALGYDAHSKGSLSDPLYFNPLIGNLALKPGSPAIGAGTNLSSVFKTDKDNSPRPSGAWCMGAYELNPANITNVK